MIYMSIPFRNQLAAEVTTNLCLILGYVINCFDHTCILNNCIVLLGAPFSLTCSMRFWMHSMIFISAFRMFSIPYSIIPSMFFLMLVPIFCLVIRMFFTPSITIFPTLFRIILNPNLRSRLDLFRVCPPPLLTIRPMFFRIISVSYFATLYRLIIRIFIHPNLDNRFRYAYSITNKPII